MENKNENIDINEDDSIDNNDSFDIDKENLTLIDVNKKLSEKRSKQEQNSLFLKLKRNKPEKSIIEYDHSSNSILNVFCPSKEEMIEFLENCEIQEISFEEFKNKKFIEGIIFNPTMYMKKNQINKSYLSFEDLQLNNEENEDLNESSKEIIPLIDPGISNINKNENPVQLIIPNSPKENLKNILKTDILSKAQKDWLNNYIKEIINIDNKSLILNGKKLEIVFDLDNTLIFNYIQTRDKKTFDDYFENYQNNDLNILEITRGEQEMYSGYIIRQGIKEFIDFTKKFCNFNINTLSYSKYAIKIIKKLEKEFNIKFGDKIMKTEKNKYIKKEKRIDEFKNKRINQDNTIIFDDYVTKWENDFANVIPSKYFFDKKAGIKNIDNNNKDLNNFACIKKSHGKFFYHCFYENKKIDLKWKVQLLIKLETCPFFYFKEINKNFFFDIYNAEYFNSNKKQFLYMKNVVKVIYYMVYHDEIPISEAIMLIRLNVLYKKYFYLKYINKDNIDILSHIIKICGGEIIEPDESIEFAMKKKFLVCSFDVYEKERKIILEEKKDNYLLVNEKFILDCYYFMTDLEDEYENKEYDPESCYQESKSISSFIK